MSMDPSEEWLRLCEEFAAARDRVTALTGEAFRDRFASPQQMDEIKHASDDMQRIREHMTKFAKKHA